LRITREGRNESSGVRRMKIKIERNKVRGRKKRETQESGRIRSLM